MEVTFKSFHELLKNGEMAEWSKAHAWKVCIRQKRIKGSNPFLSAGNENHLKLTKTNLISH